MTKGSNQKLDSIESAINDIRSGKVIIVVDDENRENEGDFLAAAETITPAVKSLLNCLRVIVLSIIIATSSMNTNIGLRSES